jgi:hypothetical protein
MNIVQLFQDFNIPHYTEGYKWCRPGWVNIECPFCTGNPGPHMGFNLEQVHCFCWRCGWHPTIITISKLIHVNEFETEKIVKRYGHIISHTKQKNTAPKEKEFKFPSAVHELKQNHKQYLLNRNFDPDYLESEWNLLATGPISLLHVDKKLINYKHRIIIPFIWNNNIVSFDSRDITGHATNKYQACPEQYEVITHKSILYGKQECWKSTGIGVEGPTDVWRFGPLSCAVSGIQFTSAQVRLIAKTFKCFAVCFDGGESQAKTQANKLVSELKFRGVDAFRVDIEGDPGDMQQSEADYLVKQIIN